MEEKKDKSGRTKSTDSDIDATNKSIKPVLFFNKHAGPKNYKLEYRTGEDDYTYVGKWQFDQKSLSYKKFTAGREALAQSISQLLEKPITSERYSSESGTVDRALYENRYYDITYSDFYYTDWNNIDLFINDDLSKSIMKGDIDAAVKLIQSGTRTACRIFNTVWTLCNQYSVNEYSEERECNSCKSLTNNTLEQGEKILIAMVDPIVLAVLTKQSSLAIELLKIDHFKIHSKIEPFNKSLIEIAEALKLNTLAQYMHQTDPVLLRKDALQEYGHSYRKLGTFFDFDESKKTAMPSSEDVKTNTLLSANQGSLN